MRWTGDRETRVRISVLPYGPIRNILGQLVNSQVPRPTKPFIPSGPMNWYQLTFSVQLPGRRVARLAAGVGAMGITRRRRPQCALLHTSFLPVACQLVKQYWSEISLYVSLHKKPKV